MWVTVAVLSLLGTVVIVHNRLVRAKVKVRQAWAQVDTQLQRRHDLLPNLVATVRAYAGHERDLLDTVVQARADALAVADPIPREGAEDRLTAAVGNLIAISEGYPDLTADENFRHLQTELAATEDRLAFARDFANDRVARYRELTDTLPGLLLVRLLRFPRSAMFATEQERARQRPDVHLER